EQGLEAYLMGVVATGTAAGISRTAQSIANKVGRESAQEAAGRIESISADLNNENISPQASTALVAELESSVGDIATAIVEDAEVENNLSKEQRRGVSDLMGRLEDIQTVLTDPSVSEETKAGFRAEAENISAEIDNLIAQTDAIQEQQTTEVPVGERAEGSQEVDGEVREQAQAEEVQTETQEGVAPVITEEAQAEPGQYFTRDIAGEETVYRRNDDGTTSIVPQEEATTILNQQTETPVQ